VCVRVRVRAYVRACVRGREGETKRERERFPVQVANAMYEREREPVSESVSEWVRERESRKCLILSIRHVRYSLSLTSVSE
jgi:hypothetical protein